MTSEPLNQYTKIYRDAIKSSSVKLSNVQKITSAENLRSRASDDELNTNSNRKNCGSYFLNIT